MSQSIEMDHVDRVLDQLDHLAESQSDLLQFLHSAGSQLLALTGATGCATFAVSRSPTGVESDCRSKMVDEGEQATPAVEAESADFDDWRLIPLAVCGKAPLSRVHDLGTYLAKEKSPTNGNGRILAFCRRDQQSVLFYAALYGEDMECPLGILALSLQEPCPHAAEAGVLTLLKAVGEIVRDRLLDARRLAAQRGNATYDQLVAELYSCGSLRELAAVIAQDLPALLQSERVSLLSKSGRTAWKLISVTGTDSLSSRTDLVRNIEKFAEDHAAPKAKLISAPTTINWDASPEGRSGNQNQLADTLIVPLDTEHNESSVSLSQRHLLIVQWSSSHSMSDGLTWITRVFPHVCRAWRIAQTGRRSLLSPLTAKLPVKGSRRRWLSLVAILVLFVLLYRGTLGAPVAFMIEAKGVLEPIDERLIFATSDGYVDQLLVQEGEQVAEGQLLVKLRAPQLELQRRELEGEVATARKRREGLAVAMNQLNSASAETMATARQIAAEVSSLDERLTSLSQQMSLLDEQLALLEIRAPIAGTVVTWDAHRNLTARPVRRGDTLLRVASIDGPWRMRLWVPDREMGHVMSGDDSSVGRNVRFKLMSRPQQEYGAKVISIGETVQPAEGVGPAIAVDCDFDRSELQELRVGATTLGRIECGERAWWYVWTRTARESIQRRFWFFEG